MIKSSPLEEYEFSRSSKSIGVSVKRNFQVAGESGLTMLRCTQLIQQFGDFTGRITISNGAISVDGRSMIDLLQLAAVSGTVLTVELTGRDAAQTMQRIEPILASQR